MPDVDLSHLPQPLRILSEQPPRKKSAWEWLRDIGITGLVVGIISGLIAAVVSAYFQHNRWYVEQNLALSKADFEAATASFDTISTELSKMRSLQEILFFTYTAAANRTDPEDMSYLAARAREIFPTYEHGRVELRQKMDSYIYGVRRNLDWASGWKRGGARNASRADPLSYGAISASSDFDCADEKTMPKSGDAGFGRAPFQTFTVDWNSSTHQLVVFDYCFRKLHALIAPARYWAGTLPPDGAPVPPPHGLEADRVASIVTQLDNQIYRLNRFTALGMTQVERIRQANAPPDFLAFVLPK